MIATNAIHINGRRIGAGSPAYVIAEMSANHGQDFERAVAIVHAAKAAGADAIKLQTFTPDLHTLNHDSAHFRVGGGTLWDGRTLHDLYSEAYMPWDWQPKLQALAAEIGIDLFSAPVDASSVDFLETLNVPAYKIASFDIVDLALVRRAARTGRPLIMSTGMASLAEIGEAVAAASDAGAAEIALLKCTSAYPAPPSEMNLRAIPFLSEMFGLPVGLSDHTTGLVSAVAAVALGACIVEKHLTLSRELPGPDRAFSLEPAEFGEMVASIRTAEAALGSARYRLGADEQNARSLRRSLFIVKDVRAGETLSAEHVRSIRPGHGLHPRHLNDVLGRKAARDIERGAPVTWDLLGDSAS